MLAVDFAGNSVATTQTIQADEWYQIALHFVGNEIILGVDGVTYSQPVNAAISAPNSQTYAMSLSIGETAEITGLKVYDWAGERKIAFLGDELTATAVTDSLGVARIPVTASPPVLAYTRPYLKLPESRMALFGHSVIRNAYAQQTSVQQCQESFLPVSPNSPDPAIAESERFLSMMLECFVKPKVEEARVNYTTSKGIVSKGITLVKRETYEGAYEVLNSLKDKSFIVANCLDATFTGGNATAVGATCDFITSVLAIGDLRDIVFQAWHYNVGDRFFDGNNYDSLTANLAAIGLIADGLQFTGVGTIPGVIINAFSAAGKPIAKALKQIGPAGVTASRVLGEQLGIIVRSSGSYTQKADQLKRFLPFMEVTAAFAVIRQSQPELFNFIASAMTSPDALGNLARWFSRYLTRLRAELGVASIQKRHWLLERFVASANAALTANIQARLVREMQELLDIFPKLDLSNNTVAARHFNEAIEVFLDRLDTPTSNPFKDIPDDFKVTKAFLVASSVGGRKAAEALSRLTGFNGLGLGNGFTTEKFVEAIALMDFNKLSNGLNLNEAARLKDEIGRTFTLVGTKEGKDNFRVAKGEVFKLLTLVEDSLNNVAIKDLEVDRIVELGGQRIGNHIMDRQRLVANGRAVFEELRSWTSGFLRQGLISKLSVKTTTKKSGELTETNGQLLVDIADAVTNGGNFQTIWRFTPEIKSSTIQSGSDVGDLLLGILNNGNNREIRKNVAQIFDVSLDELDVLLRENIEFISAVKNLFEIEEFNKLREVLNI